jgi:hypothetical protein
MAVLRMTSDVRVAIKRSMTSDTQGLDVDVVREPAWWPSRRNLVLDGLNGGGSLAEPGLEEILG